MGSGFNFRILVVDDEPSVRDVAAVLLSSKGYEVRTAQEGFAALVELRRALPDVIISDLKMPNMSGFELLSVVRRRFPQIPVIAISGEYTGIAPEGLLADAFLTKGDYTPDELFRRITDLLQQGPMRPFARRDQTLVWIPRTDTGYYVVTCTECLRSFSVPEQEARGEMREANCIYCNRAVRYLAEVQRPAKKAKQGGIDRFSL